MFCNGINNENAGGMPQSGHKKGSDKKLILPLYNSAKTYFSQYG